MVHRPIKSRSRDNRLAVALHYYARMNPFMCDKLHRRAIKYRIDNKNYYT